MFEHVQARQESNRKYWARSATIIGIVVAGGLALWRWQASHEAEMREQSRREAYANDPTLHPEKRVYERYELPGMSLELASIPSVRGHYGDGGFDELRPVEVSMVWKAGAPFDETAHKRVLQEVTNVYSDVRVDDGKPITFGGRPARQYTVSGTHGYRRKSTTVTFGECDRRWVILAVGDAIDSTATNDRIVASFRCTPDAKADLDRTPVVVDARDGWLRAVTPGHLTLESTDLTLQLRTFVLPSEPNQSVADVVQRTQQQGGRVRLQTRAGTRGDKVFWRGVIDGDNGQVPVAVLAWRCSDRERIAVIVVAARGDNSLDTGIELADTGRCLGEDERMPTYKMSP
jgi:hypothetical protein